MTNRGVKRSPSVLPYTFGAPVSGGGQLRGQGKRNKAKASQEKLTDRLGDPITECAIDFNGRLRLLRMALRHTKHESVA